MTRVAALLLGLAIATGGTGSPAAAACFAPDFAEPAATTSKSALTYWPPRLAQVGAMLKANPVLLGLDGVRLRVNTFVGHHPPNQGGLALVRATLYPPNTWVGPCGLIKGPEFFNEGALVVAFNQAADVFRGTAKAIDDGQLVAYNEPAVKERFGPATLHETDVVIVTSGGAPAWVPVTIDEYLASRRRELARHVSDAETALAQVQAAAFDAAQAENAARAIEKADPKAGAELRALNAQLKKQLEDQRREAMAPAQASVDGARQALAAFEAFAGRFSSDQRRAAMRLGPREEDYGIRAAGPDDRGRLVKLNPELSGPPLTSRRTYLIVVYPIVNEKRHRPSLVDAMRRIDFVTLAALVD